MKYLIFSFAVTSIFYLIISFISWDIIWAKDLPDWTGIERTGILFGLILKETVCILLWDTVPEIKLFFNKTIK